MVRVLVSCANGSGTSLMMKMTAEKSLTSRGFKDFDVHHCA